MRIQDNKVFFEPSDIQQFTLALQRALQLHGGSLIPPEEILSALVNEYLAAAKLTLAAQDRAQLEEFVVAFALADDATRDAAKVHLNEARAVVGVGPVAAPEEPQEAGFFAAIGKFFGG